MGAIGNSSCGDMMTMWLRFKEHQGRRVIDRATFEAFGCETAIALASRATEIVRGKTVAEAMQLTGQDFAGSPEPLPPIKVHCAQLVEGALRAALLAGPKPGDPSITA